MVRTELGMLKAAGAGGKGAGQLGAKIYVAENAAARTAAQAEVTTSVRGQLPCLDAAESATQGKSVLGHNPGYKDLAEQLGARRFNIPTEHWNKMSSAEQWAANQKFLDRMIARGDDVILATPLDKVKPGSIFERELQYLQSRGFTPSADGTRMIPGGGK